MNHRLDKRIAALEEFAAPATRGPVILMTYKERPEDALAKHIEEHGEQEGKSFFIILRGVKPDPAPMSANDECEG